MLNNLINREDAARVVRKLRARRLDAVIDRLRGRHDERVRRHWARYGGDPETEMQWWTVEKVRRRWSQLVTGDADGDIRAFIADRCLGGATGLRALSVGCGSGQRELAWARLGIFERIDAIDVSPEQVARARETAQAEGLDHVVEVSVADAARHPFPPGSYDVVLAEHSLHHLSPVDEVVASLGAALKPGGHLLLDDYVGPRRFQWTPRQLEAANAVRRAMPEAYRRGPDGTAARAVVRPSRGWMVLTDPSEAVESDAILPAVRQHLDVVFERGYGGSVLQLAFTDISQHFQDGSRETEDLLDWCFEAEDRLLASGEVAHDFVVVVAQRTDAR